MNTRIKILLIFPGANLHVAEALIRALEPDNVGAPSNINISSIVESNMLKIVIEFIGRLEEILTLRNTIDDLLQHLNVALKVVESVKDN